MASPKKKEPKKEIDPEELMRRKFRAKCQMRALIRLTMANAYWLIEDIDHYEGVEDVKRRVEQAVRTKAKKQLLSVKDKALLNKPVEDRSESEKKYIYRIIGGLKCFKRYPNHVKKKLAGLTYFKYYGPDRIIVRQHQPAHALYFIVSGEVNVTQMVYDEILEEYQSVQIGTMSAGDMFGEVSLLHNIPRTATVTTADHCEFLMLLEEDFKIVLKTSVQKQWDQVKAAMSMFTYFDQLDEVSSREGCIVAKMKTYKENEIIYGDDCEIPNHVYFILTGRVQMIETLKIFVVKSLSKTFYTLFDDYESSEESEEDFEKKFYDAYPDLKSRSRVLSEHQASGRKSSNLTTDPQVGILKKTSATPTEMQRQSKQNPEVVTVVPRSSLEKNTDVGTEVKSEDTTVKDTHENQRVDVKDEAVETRKKSVPSSEKTSKQNLQTLERGSGPMRDSGLLLLPHSRVSKEMQRPSVRYSVPTNTDSPGISGKRTLKTYFMQVCQMNPGSTFGFGENMRDRRIVAITNVSCMLMPKIWLLQRNTANIWTRIQYFLEKKIPTKQKLFEEFVKQRQWMDYKEQCVNDVVTRSNTVNYTTVHDVPYSIRLEEMYDI